MKKGNAPDDLVLCVDESSGLISDSEGEPLFDEKGQITNAISQVLVFLKECERSRIIAQQAVDALTAAGLIIEWPLKMLMNDAEIHISDVYKIDESMLYSLDDKTFLTLRNTHALAIAFAQIFSMDNIRIINQLAQIREQQKALNEPGIKGVMTNDDMFRF